VKPVTAFFPGIAWIAKGPDLVLPHTTAMVFTANAVALLAFVAVWAVAKEWRDERLARASVMLLALWPASLFYWSFYSEALFVATTAGAVWFVRGVHRWPAALLLGVAALTRSQGALVAAVIVVLRIARRRRIDGTALLYAAAATAGVLAVMYVQHQQAGDALAFLHHQDDWGRSFTFPWTTLREGIGALKSGTPRLATGLDLLGITAMGLAVIWSLWPRSRNARRAMRPLPTEAWLLTVAILIVPLCSGLLSSMNRYVAAAWSGFVVLAAWLQTAKPWVRWVVYGALALASVVFTRYWAEGEFIG
jgi:X-X-X-Leu-X-X-Gly heptad repeat protein